MITLLSRQNSLPEPQAFIWREARFVGVRHALGKAAPIVFVLSLLVEPSAPVTAQSIARTSIDALGVTTVSFRFRVCFHLSQDLTCDDRMFGHLNACSILKANLPCGECAVSVGPDQPCYVSLDAPDINVRMRSGKQKDILGMLIFATQEDSQTS